jgi:Protein of unknown function (DUF3060)
VVDDMTFRTIFGPYHLVMVLLGTSGLMSCKTTGIRPTRPLSSDRGIETLEMKEGELPKWKKTGNLKVTSNGNIINDDLCVLVQVKKNDKPRRIDARGRAVNLTGDGGTIMLVGGCQKLTISGSGNHVTSDYSNIIVVTGDDNQLYFDSLQTGTVLGDGNLITWKQASNEAMPIVDFKGINNSMEHRN